MINFNKKILAIGMAATMMTCGLAACKTAQADTKTTETTISGDAVAAAINQISDLLGGWTFPDDTSLTPEAEKIFDEAAKKVNGCFYKPVMLLGTQVVSGQTYCFLCKSTLGAKDRQDGYALCFVYINASGEAKYLKDDKIVLPGTENGGPALVGGWTYTETPDIKPDLREKIEATTARMLGTKITPEALIGTQVVAGANYAVLCRVSAVANGVGATKQYKLITFNVDLEENMTMCDVTDIQMGI